MSDDEQNLSPPHKPRAKSEFVIEVELIKKAIRSKENWEQKLQNTVIRQRYIDEAVRFLLISSSFLTKVTKVAQGASLEAMETAIAELELFELDESKFDFSGVISNYCIMHSDGKSFEFLQFLMCFEGLVPEDMRIKLENDLDVLANKPNLDYHPGSDDKVVDLIHPSLFPYIKG